MAIDDTPEETDREFVATELHWLGYGEKWQDIVLAAWDATPEVGQDYLVVALRILNGSVLKADREPWEKLFDDLVFGVLMEDE